MCVCEDFKCNGPIVLSQRGGRLKSLTAHMLSHPLAPPSPSHTNASSIFFPPPPPNSLFHPPTTSVAAQDIVSGSCALAGAFPYGDG